MLSMGFSGTRGQYKGERMDVVVYNFDRWRCVDGKVPVVVTAKCKVENQVWKSSGILPLSFPKKYVQSICAFFHLKTDSVQKTSNISLNRKTWIYHLFFSLKQVCCWFSLIALVSLLSLCWMYICLVTLNDQDEVNWWAMANTQHSLHWIWHKSPESSLLFFLCDLHSNHRAALYCSIVRQGFTQLNLWVNWFMVLIIISAVLTSYCVLLLVRSEFVYWNSAPTYCVIFF